MGDILGNNFIEGVLGVVNLNFDATDMGKTTDATEITHIEDVTDIFYEQDGTQPGDKVRTGEAWEITATFGTITTALIDKLFAGITVAGGGNTFKIGRSLYLSMKDNESKPLIIRRIEADGTESVDPLFKMKFYKAIPLEMSGFVYGKDTQRGITVKFYCFWDASESAFGYQGNPSSVGLSA